MRNPAQISGTQPGLKKGQVKKSIQVASNGLDLLYLSIYLSTYSSSRCMVLGSPRECLWVLRGRLGKALGSIGGVLDTLGSAWKLRQRFWVLSKRLRLREAFGRFWNDSKKLSGALWTPSGSSRGAFRACWVALSSSERDVGSEGARY